mmetsp:Transcript_104855/g.333704  ORF Transcript_104855/g.333704 Transcript_104855/m.333704 type:complete len:230 (+) Transcript_104855:75-764(+)
MAGDGGGGAGQGSGPPRPHRARVEEGQYPPREHPLETAWTLWVDKKSSDRREQSAYMEGLKQLGTFRTVEEFLRLFAFVKKPSHFPRDYNLLCFRAGCKPMWEEFPQGGCWNYRIRRSGGSEGPADAADRGWESLILACIGEAFETPEVVGCVMSSRVKEVALSVWNASNASDPQIRFKIGEQVRKTLALSGNALLEYKDHQGSLQDYSSYRNAQVYIMRPGGASEEPT